MEMTTAKTIAVFAIIFGCFAILYPKIFHPMMMHMLGSAQPRQTDTVESHAPRHVRGGGAHMGKPTPVRDESPGHMRGGPHPGLRAAAEMKKQAASQQSTTGKGMMGVVLPMYAVGIVIYLIYTLTKVFGRKEKGEGSGSSPDYLNNHFSGIRYNADKQKFVAGGGSQKGEETMEDTQEKIFRKQKDLEKLLLKADSEDISENEMNELKRRLMETEAQMSRILQAMEVVQQKVGATLTGNATSQEASADSIKTAQRQDASAAGDEQVTNTKPQIDLDPGSLDPDDYNLEDADSVDDIMDNASDNDDDDNIQRVPPSDNERNYASLAAECANIPTINPSSDDEAECDTVIDDQPTPDGLSDLRRRTTVKTGEE